jgi:hypothetical protein
MIVSRALSMVLIAAAGNRSGDIAQVVDGIPNKASPKLMYHDIFETFEISWLNDLRVRHSKSSSYR